MLNCFGEKQTARVAGRRMIVDPSEEIFVQHVEQEECYQSHAVDDGSNDRVAERNDNQQRH
jgi:hypothetical protein